MRITNENWSDDNDAHNIQSDDMLSVIDDCWVVCVVRVLNEY